MRLASAGRPKEQGIGALIEPAVAAIARMPRAVVSIGTISLSDIPASGSGKANPRSEPQRPAADLGPTPSKVSPIVTISARAGFGIARLAPI
jgi:hypothetical protein